jgi:hypothetical protein
MSSYIGDRLPGDVIDLKFNTVNASGVPATPTGSPATLTIALFKDNSTTANSAGQTLTLNIGGRNGTHLLRLTTASDAAFFSAGSDFYAVITVGALTGGSLVGYIVGEFSIANRVPNLAQGEPGQGVPPASTSVADKLAYLYKAWRNKKEQTATTWSLYDDAGTTVGQKATVSDNGTTAAKQKIASGP